MVLIGLPLTEEATRRGGLRAISCQAEKQHERKDTHRKPPLPSLRVAEVIGRILQTPIIHILPLMLSIRSCTYCRPMHVTVWRQLGRNLFDKVL
jgi:hypothetical protein